MPAATRSTVAQLAEEIRAGRVDPTAEVERAWQSADAESVAAYALAAAEADRALPASLVLPAVAIIEDLPLCALLVARCKGDRVKALMDTVERDDMSDEGDAVALYFAAIVRGADRAPPPRLVALLRTHARRHTSTYAGELLVCAAYAIDDEEARRVVREAFPKIDPKKTARELKPLVDALEKPSLDLLPDAAVSRVATGIPLVRGEPKVGRNDPCPCGSGKKYKKCCEGKDAAGARDPDTTWKKQLDAAASKLTPDQVYDLREHELVALKIEDLSGDALVAAYRRYLIHRRWDLAERALETIAARVGAKKADDMRVELVAEALRAHANDVGKKHAAKLEEAGAKHPILEAMLEVASPTKATLGRLEKMAARGLREDPLLLFDVADALLTDHPALGIVFGRAALTPSHPHDSVEFLELIEEARDRLGLPPGDMAGAIYDAIEATWGERTAEEAEAGGPKLEELTAEANALRARAREASGRIAELEKKLREQQRAIEMREAPSSRAGGALAAEDKSLKDRVSELKSLIAEGNQERAELRRLLAERAESARPATSRADTAARVETADGDAEGERAPEEGPRVRGTMIPRFARGAEARMRDLPARVVRDTLRVIADLCSGEASAWREVKQLERVSPPLYSARVGIHYRVLFRPEGGSLEVEEVVAREGLLTAIRRFV